WGFGSCVGQRYCPSASLPREPRSPRRPSSTSKPARSTPTPPHCGNWLRPWASNRKPLPSTCATRSGHQSCCLTLAAIALRVAVGTSQVSRASGRQQDVATELLDMFGTVALAWRCPKTSLDDDGQRATA